MRFASLFLWLIVPLGIWLAVSIYGTPHIIGTYRFVDNGDPYNPRAKLQYINCTYYGWAGMITVPAIDADCLWIQFFKSEAN